MTPLAVMTPTYRPDLEGFRLLHESVVRHTDDEVVHHVVVPGIDRDAFAAIDSPWLRVWTYGDLTIPGVQHTDRLARFVRALPGVPSRFSVAGVSRRPPWRPIRGWIWQQIAKMALAARLEARAVVIMDSDVILVRDVVPDELVADGAVRLYTGEGAVTPDMERHYAWCRTAHDLLGIPWTEEESYPDHITGLVTWSPALVRRTMDRVEASTGLPWAQAIGHARHFSEDILYGTYVRHFGTAAERAFQRGTTRCHSHWSPTPLDADGAEEFVAGLADDHLAVHIQSNSGTDEESVRAVLDTIRENMR